MVPEAVEDEEPVAEPTVPTHATESVKDDGVPAEGATVLSKKEKERLKKEREKVCGNQMGTLTIYR